MEKDDKIKSEGNSYDFGARMYDPRVGRFFAVDPKTHEHTWNSPYSFAANSPIILIDDNGELPVPPALIAAALGAITEIISQVGVMVSK